MFSRRIFSSSRHRRTNDRSSLDAGGSSPASNTTAWPRSPGSDATDGLTDKEEGAGRSLAEQTPSVGSTAASPSRSETWSAERRPDAIGLSILYTPGGDRTADIIFIHGLGGSSRTTWCKNKKLDTFWPQEWLPRDEDLHRARIFTFGYNATFRSSSQSSSLSISDFSKNLLYDMIFARDAYGSSLHLGEVPIVFVVHSMGGLVFKKAYLDAQLDARYATVMNSTRAVVFLSTPHRGSDLAPHLNRILSVSFASTRKEYVTELSEASAFLRTVNEQFRHVANRLQIFSFYETLQTSLGVFSALILDPETAKLGYPGEVSRSLHADHHSVCKFDSPRDPNYQAVLGALKALVSSCRSIDTKSGTDHIERLRVLLSIPESIDHDFNLFCSRRAEGTCKWFLEQDLVRTWLLSPSHPQVLMLHGRPARGKSVIASFLVQHLHEHGAAVQYFFFRSGDETKRSMAALIRTMAFQIAQQPGSFREALVELADSGWKPKDSEWRSSWKKLFVNLLFEMGFYPPLYWIIDGIDEATSPHHVFELLSDLHGSKIPIRVMVTNRWSQSLLSAFDRTKSKVPCAIISIDNDTTDMKLYVEEELRYSNWNREIMERVAHQVLDTANNNFLWVRLVLEELKDCNTEQDIGDRLLELPPGMDGLYQRMEESICQTRRPSDKNLARQLLTWVIHARRTLVVEELADVLEPEFGRLLDISQTTSRLCGHFIAVERDNKIGLIHQTAREYLTTTPTLPFSLGSGVAHGELFKQSIMAFLDKGRRSKLHRTSPTLLKYRATSWPYHLSSAEFEEKVDGQLDLLSQFFSQPSVLIWIQVLASLGQLGVLIEASQSIYMFVRRKRKAEAAIDPACRRFDDLELLEGWSRDLLKLLGKFGGCLTQNPAAIYNSIAPFCPTTSSIYKVFGGQEASSLKIDGLPEDWSDCLARASVGSECVATMICCSGRYIAAATSKKTVVMWDCTTFHQVHVLELGEAVSALCFSSKGDRLATYGYRQTKIWSPGTGKVLMSIPNHPGMQALCLQFVDNDSAIIMGSDHRCVLRAALTIKEPCAWNTISPRLVNDAESLEGAYLNSPTALAISPDGSKIAASYRRFPLTIWSIDPAVPVKRLTRPQNPGQTSKPLPFVSSVSWHPSGDEILGLFMDGYSFRLNIVDGLYLEYPPTPGQMPSDIVCSPDGVVYAVCEVRGSVRLFDYQSSTLIYQLNSEDSITGFCFSHDGRRFYDIRGSHCTTWEPNALMRLSTVDDNRAPSQGADDSVGHSQVASESFNDDSVPIVLMSPSPQAPIVCIGNEEGLLELFDYETSEKTRVGQTASQMSIEHLAWSHCGKAICYAELGSRLTVVRLELGNGGNQARRVERFKPKMESGEITQLLFLPGSESLLVSSSSSVQSWSLEPARLQSTFAYGPSSAPRKWVSHPRSPQHVLSITTDSVSVHRRDSLEEVSTCHWDDAGLSPLEPPSLDQTQSSAVRPADVHEEIDSVDATFLDGHLFIKTSRRTASCKLRPRFLILDVGQLPLGTISPISVPSRVSQKVEMPLNVLANGKLVFIDQSFWVCSWHVRSGRRMEDVQRHFFIPRDWLPLQSLGLLQITSSGAILCPRRGGVSVVHSSIGSAF